MISELLEFHKFTILIENVKYLEAALKAISIRSFVMILWFMYEVCLMKGLQAPSHTASYTREAESPWYLRLVKPIEFQIFTALFLIY